LTRQKNTVETARLRAEEIRAQSAKTVERDNMLIQQQLSDDLQRLRERGEQGIQLERQRTIQTMVKQISHLALTTAESTMFRALWSQGSSSLKQKELNEVHVRDTFRQLKT
jgi:F0F1-type ATP synthase membrane subunit b/b'